MSIATLKKKTAAKYNNMSVSEPKFSINGGHRSQGWVGQTTLSRSLPKTPMVGNTPKGSGGCCGTYRVTPIVQSAVKSTNDNLVMKESVLSTDGMLDTKYRWIRRPAPYVSVKSDNNHNLNLQSDYISRKSKTAINDAANCPDVEKDDCLCEHLGVMYKNRINTPYNNRDNIQKTVDPLSESEYINTLSNKCATIDEDFQKTQGNTKGPCSCSC